MQYRMTFETPLHSGGANGVPVSMPDEDCQYDAGYVGGGGWRPVQMTWVPSQPPTVRGGPVPPWGMCILWEHT